MKEEILQEKLVKNKDMNTCYINEQKVSFKSIKSEDVK
jgi:hypothetical protein